MGGLTYSISSEGSRLDLLRRRCSSSKEVRAQLGATGVVSVGVKKKIIHRGESSQEEPTGFVAKPVGGSKGSKTQTYLHCLTPE